MSQHRFFVRNELRNFENNKNRFSLIGSKLPTSHYETVAFRLHTIEEVLDSRPDYQTIYVSRYLYTLPWFRVAQDLNVSEITAKRYEKQLVDLLGDLLMAKETSTLI